MMFVKAIIIQYELLFTISAVYEKHSSKDRKPHSGVLLWRREDREKEGGGGADEKKKCALACKI